MDDKQPVTCCQLARENLVVLDGETVLLGRDEDDWWFSNCPWCGKKIDKNDP